MQKVTLVSGKKETWSILRSPTKNRIASIAPIISDKGKYFASQKQKADGFVRFHRDVNNLNFEKHDR